MARKEADVKIIEIVNQMNPDFYHWTDEEKATIGTNRMFEVIKNRLESKKVVIENMHAIIHDRDVLKKEFDPIQKKHIETPKALHFHCLIKLSKGVTLTNLSIFLGIEPQFINKATKGKNVYENMLAYLVHAKDKNKFQYKATDVLNIKGFDYVAVYENKKDIWKAGSIIKEKTKNRDLVLNIIDDIHAGIITHLDEILLNPNYYKIYSDERNRKMIVNALEVYYEKKVAETIRDIKEGKFRITVYFVTGKSGVGKSYFTSLLAEDIKKEMQNNFNVKWHIYQACGNNSFDNYKGEEIAIMDDLRGSSMQITDWLKLLDNERINPMSCRYKNKDVISKVIIINSEKTLVDFFKATDNSADENLDQFLRRITAYIHLKPVDYDERVYEVGFVQKCEPYTNFNLFNKALTYNHNKNKKTYTNIDECIKALIIPILETNSYLLPPPQKN